MNITASKLYDYLQCPHRVWRDANGPQEEKEQESNPFVEMLWEKGVSHEKDVVAGMGEFLDVSEGTIDERFRRTMEAVRNGEPLIYQGVLRSGNLLGIPDLLRRMPDGKYVPIDIKSGSGFEGGDDEFDDGKPKKHYAVQLCFYVELLRSLGIPNAGTGKIIDIHSKELEYDLSGPTGKRASETWWDFYGRIRENVRILMADEDRNKPALSGKCKVCPWYRSCKKWCEDNDDLSNIFYVGGSQRDTMGRDLGIDTVAGATGIDIGHILEQKKKDKNFLKGIGESVLEKMVKRARILAETKKPVVYGTVEFPKVSYELFFDIEDDPTQEFVYMHGVYERSAAGERYVDFTATEKTKDAEREAWKNFWEYVCSLPKDGFAVYYYSHHEKTTYRKMQKLYPDVVSAREVEEFFGSPKTVDLYSVVLKHTDWPVSSYSLKGLAQYLGFQWRDKTPSGALSIQWFNEYLKTKDPKIMERILEYNEDDCKATMVLKDGIEKLADWNQVKFL